MAISVASNFFLVSFNSLSCLLTMDDDSSLRVWCWTWIASLSFLSCMFQPVQWIIVQQNNKKTTLHISYHQHEVIRGSDVNRKWTHPQITGIYNYYYDPAHCVYDVCDMVSAAWSLWSHWSLHASLPGFCLSLWSPCTVSAGLLCLPGLCWSSWSLLVSSKQLARHPHSAWLWPRDWGDWQPAQSSSKKLTTRSWAYRHCSGYACLLYFAEKVCYRSVLVVLCIRSSVQCSWVFRWATKVWRQTWCLLIWSFCHLPCQSRTTTHTWFSCHTVEDVQKKQWQIGKCCSKNSHSRKCTVIWLDKLPSFLQHQLLKGSNCSNAHMHLAYYCTLFIVLT